MASWLAPLSLPRDGKASWRPPSCKLTTELEPLYQFVEAAGTQCLAVSACGAGVGWCTCPLLDDDSCSLLPFFVRRLDVGLVCFYSGSSWQCCKSFLELGVCTCVLRVWSSRPEKHLNGESCGLVGWEPSGSLVPWTGRVQGRELPGGNPPA